MEKERYADASPTIVFIFTMLCMMFWAQFAGICSAETTLFLGLIQLGCWPSYLIGSHIVLSRGDAVSGNIYLIFATCFGGIGGLVNLFTYLSGVFGWLADNSIVGITWIWSGIATLAATICIRKSPWVGFMVFLLAVFQLEIMGFVTIGILTAPIWTEIAKWLCLIIGIGGFYTMLSGLLTYGGIYLPQGKTIFK